MVSYDFQAALGATGFIQIYDSVTKPYAVGSKGFAKVSGCLKAKNRVPWNTVFSSARHQFFLAGFSGRTQPSIVTCLARAMVN